MARKKTKTATRNSTFCDIVGPPEDLPQSELPTLRQMLQYCLFIQQNSVDITPIEITDEVSTKIEQLWRSANPQLPLIITINRKVENAYAYYC